MGRVMIIFGLYSGMLGGRWLGAILNNTSTSQ